MKLTSKPNSAEKNKTGGWRTFIPKIDKKKCISCGLCAKVCPEGVIQMQEQKNFKKKKPQVDYNFCKGCGVCAQECPVKAIEMELDQK